MDNRQLRESILILAQLNRRLLERTYNLEASVNALKVVVARSARVKPEEAAAVFSPLEDQFRQNQSEREGLKQIDATIELLRSGKRPDNIDA
jgi:hypothetical protein